MIAIATPTHCSKPEEPCFLTVKETACYLRLCEKQVRRLISRGELPAYRFGTALRIKKKDIDAYVRTQRIRAVYETQ
jgi:excisionase family DNA binding protein